MAIGKKEKREEGAPAWMVTYGDMMSLLLCFFVILVSMSELKQDTRFKKVMESIRIAFGYEGGMGRVRTDVPPEVSLLKMLQNVVIPKDIKATGDAHDPGIDGKRVRITQIRESYKISFGGRVLFARFSDKLIPGSEEVLAAFADRVKGLTNVIEIVGHTTREELPSDCGFADKDELAFARARAAKRVLTDSGVNPRRIELISVADRQPIYREVYNEERRARNRTVEIIVNEALINEFEGQGLSTEETLNYGR